VTEGKQRASWIVREASWKESADGSAHTMDSNRCIEKAIPAGRNSSIMASRGTFILAIAIKSWTGSRYAMVSEGSGCLYGLALRLTCFDGMSQGVVMPRVSGGPALAG